MEESGNTTEKEKKRERRISMLFKVETRHKKGGGIKGR